MEIETHTRLQETNLASICLSKPGGDETNSAQRLGWVVLWSAAATRMKDRGAERVSNGDEGTLENCSERKHSNGCELTRRV